MFRTCVARNVLSRVVVLFVMVFPLTVHAEDVIAILDLKFIEDTGRPAGYLCLGEGEEDCVEWAPLYLFEARVRKVLKGELPRKPFRLLGGRHALMKKDIRGVVAILKKLEESNPDEPQYQIQRWGSKMELYCFGPSVEEQKQTNVAVDLEGVSLSCYDP